jgi:hypothetical protein
MRKQLFSSTEPMPPDEKKTACNSLREQLKELKLKHERCEKRLASIEPTIIAMRTAELNKWSHKSGSEEPAAIWKERQKRNDLVHGGNITEDYKLIGEMSGTNPRRADAWKRGFGKTYGISYEACPPDLENPASVKKLNKTATTNSRKPKRKAKNNKAKNKKAKNKKAKNKKAKNKKAKEGQKQQGQKQEGQKQGEAKGG